MWLLKKTHLWSLGGREEEGIFVEGCCGVTDGLTDDDWGGVGSQIREEMT